MPFNSSFQLSLELTKLLGLGRQAVSATQALVTFARDLRNSGSDIVVEEDLADVFGRMRIEHTIEADFKKRVLVDTSIVPLYQQCEIQLQYGPGPTVQRAFRDQDRRYLSTVVQLSMLASVHDRTELASALSENLNKRSAAGLPGANMSPGFEGILKTLEACVSQTSAFVWYGYMQSVRSQLREVLDIHLTMMNADSGVLRQDILLAAMDYLCLVQSLPDDRKMILHVLSGCIPLIVWAHHILGMTVQVMWRGKQLWFGKGDPQVVVNPHSRYGFEKIEGHAYSAVSLLDSGMEVVLAQVPQTSVGVRLRSQERHTLCGIGTEFMRRYFYAEVFDFSSRKPVNKTSSLLYIETAQLVVALAIYKSSTLYRMRCFANASAERGNLPCMVDLEHWRIFDAASVVFHGVELDDKEINSYVKRLARFKPEDLTIRDLDLPTSLDATLHLDQKDPIFAGKELREDVEVLIASLTVLLLNIAHIKELQECHDMPIVLNFGSLVSRFGMGFVELLAGGKISLRESTVFYGLASLLVGPTFEPKNYEGCFLISDSGWSVFLSCCDDCDPATVRPELISVQKGVPTDMKTQERKLRMADFSLLELSADNIDILDRGVEYLPRCVRPIRARTEYFTSRADSFLLDIQFVHDEADDSTVQTTSRTSYRNLHMSLWELYSTSGETRCRHLGKPATRAKLNLGVVTTAGYGWGTDTEGILTHHENIPERICICLVAGDHRARWLITQNAARSKERNTMLRDSSCCPDCALQILAHCEGKWILVL